ncbi:hypothetical protein F441_22875 [Phytophthora nicotianae CJ01A1]|uniref:Uncharacterized protein n=2 Tax=Phytophthora nicotianae TaxID=4792 RepID=W2VMY8_PHYNI|nr:hypothetical protein L917_21604 [Phytophthora nicotianae]ETO99706.1 hypothetical protein F441_22875 [Phytophthora nicotianae CJ01A1]
MGLCAASFWLHVVVRRIWIASSPTRPMLRFPYVLFCQHKYDVVRHKLESARTDLADCLNALQERLDISRELEACRLRYRDLKLRYNEVVSKFHDRISTLEAQLAAASSFVVVVPPDTARRIDDMESQLSRSQSDLQVARDRQSVLASELRESATSPQNCSNRAELGRLQDRVSTQDRDLQKASQRAQAATSQRDQARAAQIATQDRVSAARNTIARLEKRINQVERDELLGQLGERFMEVTDLRAERDQAQERLSNIASLLPSAPINKRARSESESPAQSTRVSKAARSTSHLSQAGTSSHAPASRPSIEVLSAVAAGQKAEGSVLSLAAIAQ